MTDQTSDTIPSKVVDQGLLRERRDQLIAAALDLFMEKGFHATTIREIARAAGWQMGTLYLYIQRKEDVLSLITESIMSGMSEGLFALEPGATHTETFQRVADFLFDHQYHKRREISLIYRESASVPRDQKRALKAGELRQRAFIADIIRRGIEAGEFNDVNPELFAHDVLYLAHMWSLKYWAFHDTVSIEEFKRFQLELLLARLLRNEQ